MALMQELPASPLPQHQSAVMMMSHILRSPRISPACQLDLCRAADSDRLAAGAGGLLAPFWLLLLPGTRFLF